MTLQQFRETFERARREIASVVAGQERAIEHLLAAVFAGGHVLLSGMPGLGRTLLVKSLAQVLGLAYQRIQFTPDLLPTDIIGAEVLEHNAVTGERHFRFFKGPVFANLLLADEINRSPTRTQNTLLEVMQERQVTAGGHTYPLPKPFILLATQNTLDTEGVFHLGEAQVDRFMMMIEQDYPAAADEKRILAQTTCLEQRCRRSGWPIRRRSWRCSGWRAKCRWFRRCGILPWRSCAAAGRARATPRRR